MELLISAIVIKKIIQTFGNVRGSFSFSERKEVGLIHCLGNVNASFFNFGECICRYTKYILILENIYTSLFCSNYMWDSVRKLKIPVCRIMVIETILLSTDESEMTKIRVCPIDKVVKLFGLSQRMSL